MLKRCAPLLSLLCIWAGLQGEVEKIAPSAPVRDFMLPMFGPDGYKIWDLQGAEGIYVDQHQIDVHDMKLRTWTGREPLQLDMTIESVYASIFPEENRAQGEDYIFIVQAHGNYSIIGRSWRWSGDERKIIIHADARVTFRQSIGDILQ